MRSWLVIASLAGAVAVALGAMAAHVADPDDARRLEVAVRYLMWHALALLGVAWLATGAARRWASVAGGLFCAGMLLFSGSLALSVATGTESVTLVAPSGGLAYMAGWLALGLAGLTLRRQ